VRRHGLAAAPAPAAPAARAPRPGLTARARRWLVPSLFFYAAISSLGNYMTSQRIVRPPFYVALVAAALHPGVNYLLIDVLGARPGRAPACAPAARRLAGPPPLPGGP